MSGPEKLLETEGRWSTTMGASFPGERVVFRGKDLFHDLGSLSWMQLYLYGITGRIFGEHQSKLFEGIWVLSTSYPDPRLWNNRIASLAGTARSTGSLGVSAAMAVSDASIYGGRPEIRAMNFLLRAQKSLDAGKTLVDIIESELAKYRNIYGYGRPIINVDERIGPLHTMAKELGLADGPYVKLAFTIEETLLANRWRMHMNVASLIAAIAADQDLTERQFYLYMLPTFIGGIVPCFSEANERGEGTFLPIRCDQLAYAGPGKRQW